MMILTSNIHINTLLRRFLTAALLILFPLFNFAQTDTIRYVKTEKNGGAYNNDGKSWDKAKNNLQDAINDLYDYLQRNNLHSGSVYVAAGTYYPSESTGNGAKGILSTSFKIYAGIHVYGGFNPDSLESKPGDRILSTSAAWRRITAGLGTEVNTTFDSDAKITEFGDTIMSYDFKYATILEGNHNSIQTTFKWNDVKKQYTTRFPGNSYHVVWFATNGFYNDSKRPNYADSLTYSASIDGCIIQGGNAGAKTIAERDPATMGGGAYMVRKAVLSNCIVRNCSASLRGGGVYMDGGGSVIGCNIYENQTLGLGVVDGYGGGICEDQNGVVKDTWVHNNVARIGGGIAMRYEPAEHPLSDNYKALLFDPYASACIINNNTAQTEAGGVLLYKGGVINHCSIVMNDCPGADITVGTNRYGRTGGLYVYGAGLTYNSVIWGNTCAANNDIQYATTAATVYSKATLTRPEVQYTAVNKNDITDWSNTYRKQVYSVEDKNNVADKNGNFVVFRQPSATSGAKDIAFSPRSWAPQAVSYLKGKGVQVSTLTKITDFDRKAHVTHDFFHSVFYPVSTVGALRAKAENVAFAQLLPVDGSSTTDKIPTLFVDPNRVTSDTTKTMGASWDYPLGNISEAIYYMKEYKKAKKYFARTQILVKQGTMNTAGPSSFLIANLGEETDLQSAAIRLADSLLVYGGYPSALKGTSTEGRNPKAYPSRITGNIIDDWTYNAVHCVGFINVRDAVVDGFELYYGNAIKTGKTSSYTQRLMNTNGGGVIISNWATDQPYRKDMTGNVIRNCVFANSMAAEGGSALFVNGALPKKDGTPSACGVEVVNCIFHNNSSIVSGQTGDYKGIITVRGNATVKMDHCTICNNVGIPLEAKKVTVDKTYTPTLSISNSAIYANTTAALTSRDGITASNLAALTNGDGTITGSNNLVDSLYSSISTASTALTNINATPVFGYSSTNDKTYPKFVNPVSNIGPRENLTDVTLYGGIPDYTPMDMNPMVNAAGSPAIQYNFDLTSVTSRAFGGKPDIGAIENATLPAAGTTYYVRTPADGGSDSNAGTSWSTAFATLTKALNTASSGQEIWIAAGTYKEAATVTMVNGVSVYGGFKAYGNPGKQTGERDISNLHTEYQTILDGAGNKQVVRQSSDFENATTWEGLTIQNGYLATNSADNGGAGIMIRKNMTLKNCLVRKNTIYLTSGGSYGGGGIWMKNGTVLDCIIRNNKLTLSGFIQGCGAGVRMDGGTLINSMIVENNTDKKGNSILGVGLFISSQSYIYNSTIAYNVGWINKNQTSGVRAVAPGVWDNSLNSKQVDAQKNNDEFVGTAKFYNCIFWGNAGYGNTAENYVAVNRSHYYNAIGKKGIMYNCYHSSPTTGYAVEGVNTARTQVTDTTKVYVSNSISGSSTFSTSNVSAYIQACGKQNLFNESSYNVTSGTTTMSVSSYDGSVDFVTDNPYSINPASYKSKNCINMGDETYGDELSTKFGVTVDIAGADRVQDCRIDKGAYEFNGSSLITPEKSTEKISYYTSLDATKKTKKTVNVATYYVAQNANEKGSANASSATNTACARKLQQVLDDAGRYKYDHPDWHVVVKLAGTKGIETHYEPSRSTIYEGNTQDPRSYSLQVPHGVEVSGGWNSDFTARDPINYPTYLWGKYQSTSSASTDSIQVYHVVTFTDYVFDYNGRPRTVKGADGKSRYELLSDSITTYLPNTGAVAADNRYSRAQLNGVIIERGNANGILEENQRGGACVVPSWATVINCIAQRNSASGDGGAFYLENNALIAGCIIQSNSAKNGGAIAIEEPDTASEKTFACVSYCTVTGNTASAAGGGLYFLTNLRSLCNVFWLNKGNDQSDVSGVTNVFKEQNINNYPLNYSAVTNIRVAGVNNISVEPTSDAGVRWQADSKATTAFPYQYYGLQKTSVLTRAGLPYATFRTLERLFPEIDTLDIAGVSRLSQTAESPQQKAYDGTALVAKDNVNVEIGARAINDAYVLAQSDALFYRLFVVHHDAINTSDALILQNSSDKIYKQIGSSFANPFMRLDDAINYIVDARNKDDKARNHRFEIFLAGGTYYPYTDMRGAQGEVRLNTFEMPEGVAVYGGFDVTSSSAKMYCQIAEKRDTTVTATINGTKETITLTGATTDSMRLARARYDMNKNSIVEPWEMENQTILSGYSVGADQETKNVYHVITCNEDSTSVGRLPDMYSDEAFTKTTTHNFYERTKHSDYECTKSIIHRSIILDGLTIRDGSAMGYESAVVNPNWYYRGGGIFVSGYPIKQETDAKVNPTDMEYAPRNIHLLISGCLFENNNARQGGAIYTDGTMDITGCSFVQNYTKSPDEDESYDREFVTYSGGGAIATTNQLIVANTIFANNEAQRGTGKMVLSDGTKAIGSFVKPINQLEDGKSGNDLAGYGGVIWAGIKSHIYMLNCNAVRNKAYAYPSVYNYTPNGWEEDATTHKLVVQSGLQHHYGLNSIFWGNEATDSTHTSSKMLMNYGTDPKEDNEALYFCAYENGQGLAATTNAEGDNTDYREYDVTSWDILSGVGKAVGNANHNIILNSDNSATDGPNFISPSTEAGIKGYMQSADWLVYRVNNLTDNGWGMITQKVDNGQVSFVKQSRTAASGTKEEYGVGAYFDAANYYNDVYGLTLLPVADEKYMMYADENNEESTRNMLRVSSDPLSNATKDYVDIGVYEYQHSQLFVEDGTETDVLWVKPVESTDIVSYGSTPEKATSDLQRAIETLLLSRNDHAKTIKIITGDYMPRYTLDEDNIGFQIHMGDNASIVALKKKIISGHDYMANSLTIEGGYTEELEGVRNPEEYPVRLIMDKKSGATADNTAHLFYISDAEQWGTQGNGSSSQDGETIDNSNITKSSAPENYPIPIILDGLTFVNNYATASHTETGTTTTGGAAIYYKEQFKTGTDKTTKTTEHLVGRRNIPKLTIRNCIFEQNGARGADKVPAVRIEQGGGRTLIFNSVFHSGSGNPIESTDTVSIVNCTFARNGGHITLSGNATGNSSLYNSIIWRDDSIGGYKTPYSGFTSSDNANAITTDSIKNNAMTGITNTDEAKNNANVGLTDVSTDALGGPNFVDADNAVPSKRDFHINPGVRTFSRANYLLYARKVLGWVPGMTITQKDKTTLELTEANIKSLLADTAYTKDLSFLSRLYASGMERGAYEIDNDIQRYLFVDPNKVSGTMTGLSWQNAFGAGMLQRAIDAASVYTSFNPDNIDTPVSFVFVKGENGTDAGTENITLRNGVSVLGSIDPNYLTMPKITEQMTTDERFSALMTFLGTVRAERPGLLAKTTHRTVVAGIKTGTNSFSYPVAVSGLEVRNSNKNTSPVINIADNTYQQLLLSEVYVHGNTIAAASGGTMPSVVNLQGGLLYNALIEGNAVGSTTTPVVTLGTKAMLLNGTVIADVNGQTAVGGTGLVENSITYNTADAKAQLIKKLNLNNTTATTNTILSQTGNPFAPYLNTGNAYTLPTYLTEYTPYHFQLHEQSAALDAGLQTAQNSGVTNPVSSTVTELGQGEIPTGYMSAIDYATDRDLLGNPRLLANTVDLGCFETWHIAEGQHRYATSTNNRYPHEGSVVYIGKNGSLSLGTSDDTQQLFTDNNAFMPGYLYLAPGASLYGNGNIIHAAYVAVDHTFDSGTQYALMAFPYALDADNAITVAGNATDGTVTETPFTDIQEVMTYNGEKRSSWDYSFRETNSACWESVTSHTVDATQGWLAELAAPMSAATTVRFTAWGAQNGTYPYTEGADAKTVTLTQYNHTTSTDGDAHFTKEENMGWNLTGLPYLISGYNTSHYDQTTGYDMNVPHLLYTSDGKGQYATTQSWSDNTMSMGQGYFMQTAIIGDAETVTFLHQDVSKATPAAKPYVTIESDDGLSDAIEVNADADNPKTLTYTMGADGLKWQAFNDSLPEIYLLTNSGLPLQLAGNAPTGVPMTVGFRAAKAGTLTVSIPDTEAFNGEQVWLKDEETGNVTDLTEGTYSFATNAGYNDKRLTLQIGGVRPDGSADNNTDDEPSWTVRGNNGSLLIENIHHGDHVAIHTLSGALVEQATASDSQYVTHPLASDIYIVSVNGKSKKIRVR
ncbi:hypothetical protein [Prevotella sp. AGR2160]|uniref:hypothetical protein n=1 Tax=Prevotella sp. AGR2160 TaxID=1280674 RepID=UPI00049058DE|nr:hypothetical protein [Prevotella sp. AGR2160]